MSQTRQRPRAGPDDDFKPTSGIHVGGRQTMGLIFIILCAIFHISIGCATEAGRLHDMERRTKNYKSVIGEPLVTDYKITEGWYSLDEYRMVVEGTANLTWGSCGTRYQIVIKEGSTIDWNSLDGNGITLTATVYGRPEGHGEDLEIRVRKCDDSLQYYIKPPSIRLAAYCFDSMDTDPVADEEGPLNIQGSIYVSLQGSLNFREELRDGQLYDVPYATLTCNVIDHGLGDSFPEIQFITFTWFADNARIKSTGPQSISNATYGSYGNVYLTSSNLTEDEFLAAGFSLGAVIRCGAQLSQSTSGKLSSMITTSYDTNLHLYTEGTGKTDDSDKLMLSVYSTVPLGCAVPVATVEENCAVKLRLIGDDGSLVCSDGPNETDEHELCGITLFGQTKNGTNNQYRHYTDENGTRVYENYVVYIQVESTLDDVERPTHVYLSLTVIENTAGHALWNNVNIRNVKVDLPEMWTEDHGYFDFNIYPGYPPRIALHGWNQRDDTYVDNQLSIEETGKYIMLRTGRFPFTFEVEIESTATGDLMVCGAYLRYGNDIYAYSVCGGVFVDGLIFGDGFYIPEAYTHYVHFKEVGLTYNAYLNEGQLSMNIGTNPGFNFESIEGVFSFGNGEMVGRHGNVFTNGSAGFLRSWRIGESESLSNPDNHVYYSLESKYTTCVCPTKTVDIPERETTYAAEYYINYNVYTGALYCNLDEVCSDVTVGEEWPTTLRPDYLIEEVRVGCEQRVDDAGEPLLWFTCQFNSVQDKLYTAIWYIDNVVFKRIEAATSDTEFGLNEAEIGEDFVFDMKIQCSVSVLDGSLNELISPIMSDVFEPIHFSSTYINIQRGGDGTITWTSNIPFLCHGDYTDCHMELQLFDPNDTYDCADSTVAFKAENDCGGRVQATKTIPASTGNDNTVIVTTKNNLDYGLKTYFELRAMVIFHGAGRATWTHLLRTVFIVTVVDELLWTGMDCHLHVDPHARSADGRYYEMQYIGMFVLARHLVLPIQVQVITMSCWESSGYWSPTCACALVFQAGLDIYLLDRCNGARFSGFLLAEDGVLDVYEEVDNRYKVIFPNTMMVEVRIMPYFNYFMNVDIYPSPNEQRNLVGLCGNFNGDTNDDFQLRDAADQGSTEDFSMSWELHETGQVEAESLLEEKNYMNPTPWSSEQTLCVCPNARDATNTQSDPLCSANEENTCTIPKDHKGKKLDHSQRPKRDTGEYANLDVARRVSRLRRGIAEQHAIHRKRRATLSNPNRMNETEARTICEDKFAKSPINNLTAKLISGDQFLKDCIFDVQESGSAEWATPQVIAFTSRNEAAIERNTSFAMEFPEVVTAMGQICSHECYGHGTCLGNDECECDSGWGRQSCILDLTIGPIISFITGDGLCDKSTVDCSAFVFETDGLNETFYAKVTELEADNEGNFHIKGEYNITVVAISYNEGVIDVTSGRRRRSTSSDPVLATQYGVSVSNNGVNYGNVTYVTVLDTRCQETTNNSNGDLVVALMAGYCYIDGVCYGEGNSSVDNSCKICRTATSLFDWTDDNCPTTATPSNGDGIPLYVIIFSATGGVVVIFIIVGGILFFRHTQKRRPVTPLPPPPPYPEAAPVGPMNLRFYLKGVERQSLDQYERPTWRY